MFIDEGCFLLLNLEEERAGLVVGRKRAPWISQGNKRPSNS